MAQDRFRRFLHLERPRGERPAGPAGEPGPDRFGALERPGAPGDGDGAGEQAAGGHLDRFRPPPARDLDLGERPRTAQPFVRCCRCETDNSLYAVRCTTCQEPLDTDEQRAFNERLWAGRLAEREAEERAHAEREAALLEERQRAAEARRQAAELMAAEVGERERRRLGADGLGGLDDGPRWGEPTWGPPGAPGGGWAGEVGIGVRLFRAIKDPRWRLAAIAAAVALPVLLFLVAPRVAMAAGLILLAVLVPPRYRWRRRWW
jgi:hypothetical protein